MLTRAVSQEVATFTSTETNLKEELRKLDARIDNSSRTKISHNEVILLLETISKAYENKFIPFHTAARNIHLTSKDAENKFNEAKSRLEAQFQAVSRIWETHKNERSVAEECSLRFKDNRVKNLFKRSSSLLQKSSVTSQPPSKSSSYSLHFYESFFSVFDFFNGFLLGALLC